MKNTELDTIKKVVNGMGAVENFEVKPNTKNILGSLIFAGIAFRMAPTVIESGKEAYSNLKNMDWQNVKLHQKAMLVALGSGVVIPWATIAFYYYVQKLSENNRK